ncbi:hypothetical protein [Humidesulfovibrio idahonensis]
MRHPLCKVIVSAALLAAFALPAPNAQAINFGGLFGSPVDAELAAQVPPNKREAMNKADYELACANQDLELAKLKEELADKQDDLANLNTKLAKSQSRAAEIALDIAKMEAIIGSNLGNAQENEKILKDLKTDRAKNETERSEYKSKIAQSTLFVRDWTQRVAVKEKSVAEFKARRSGGSAAAAASAASAVQAPKPEEEPTVIINPEPEAAPEAAPATPESDLNN